MDGISAAASIIGIASGGVQISVKLATLSFQVKTAPERITSISNDVSIASSVLQQLGDLISENSSKDGASIFSTYGITTTLTSAQACERIFQQIDGEAKKASQQLSQLASRSLDKIRLSKSERMKWPFLQPRLDALRDDLKEAKGSLMLMLQISSLALSKKVLDSFASPHQYLRSFPLLTECDRSNSVSTRSVEQADMTRTILALHDMHLQKPLIDNHEHITKDNVASQNPHQESHCGDPAPSKIPNT